jgi:hypothetical protein
LWADDRLFLRGSAAGRVIRASCLARAWRRVYEWALLTGVACGGPFFSELSSSSARGGSWPEASSAWVASCTASAEGSANVPWHSARAAYVWLLQERCSPPMARRLFRRRRSAGNKRRIPVAVHHVGREGRLLTIDNLSLSVMIEQCTWRVWSRRPWLS